MFSYELNIFTNERDNLDAQPVLRFALVAHSEHMDSEDREYSRRAVHGVDRDDEVPPPVGDTDDEPPPLEACDDESTPNERVYEITVPGRAEVCASSMAKEPLLCREMTNDEVRDFMASRFKYMTTNDTAGTQSSAAPVHGVPSSTPPTYTDPAFVRHFLGAPLPSGPNAANPPGSYTAFFVMFFKNRFPSLDHAQLNTLGALYDDLLNRALSVQGNNGPFSCFNSALRSARELHIDGVPTCEDPFGTPAA